MGVYSRFKKNPDGLRHLVELLESTPMSRRQRMIDVGMAEDAHFTQRALSFVLVFEDIVKMPDMELAEVLGAAPARVIGYAIYNLTKELQTHFLSKSPPRFMSEIKEVLEMPGVTAMQISGGQSKLIEFARKMERRGLVKTKRIEV